MAAEANIIRYVITGEDGEVIPENATHVSVHPTVRIIPARLFCWHPNIVELICHDGVIKIEAEAFYHCRRLKRVIMKSVEEVEECVFDNCTALEHVECEELEIIGAHAFSYCISMTRFNLLSAKTVLNLAFRACEKLKYVTFGKKLESFDKSVFFNCRDLERITLPLKNGLIQHDDTFQLCENLRLVDFVEGAVLQETIDSLLYDEWRIDMVAEIDSINQTLPCAYAGHYFDSDGDYDPNDDEGDDSGRKTEVIRNWIASVLHKVVNYKSQHHRLLKDASYRVQLALPQDIVMNNVVPFLTLPHHTFDGEIEGNDGDEELGMNSDDEDVDESHKYRLSDEEEVDANEGSVGDNSDDDEPGEACEDVTGDGERRKRRKTANDDLDGEEESD